MRNRRIMGARASSRIAIATALAIGLATPAYAQDEEPAAEEDEEIIVTGFRASVASSIEAKREADFVVDVITADDIAGLPDVSIAEGLSRLPGVTSQRTGGQSNAINIRGLSQDLVSATLNGREQVSTSRADAARSIEFEQYPSELLSQAAVYKSPKASQIEGGIAGKIELTTARPLDARGDFSGTINVRGLYNDRGDQNPDVGSYGYRVSASLNVKLSDTLGIALGYARLSQPNVATRFVGFDYNADNRIDVNGDGALESPSFGFELIQFGGREVRDGALAVVQWEPSPDFRVLIDGYYSRFRSDVRRRGIRIEGLGGLAPQDITNPVLDGDAIIGGTVQTGSGLSPTLVNQDESDRNELYTIGGNVAKDFGNVTISGDIAYSRADSFFNNQGINVDAFDATGTRLRETRGAFSATYQLNGLSLPDVALSHDFADPARNLFQGFYIVPEDNRDELWAYAGNLKWNIDDGFVKSVEAGVRYAQRDARRIVTSFDSFGIAAPVALPAELFTISGFGRRFSGAGFPDFIVADIDAVLDRFVGEDRVADQDLGFTRDQSFTLSEDVLSVYGQVNFDNELGDMGVRGNIGLRYARTDQSSRSSSGGTELTVGDKFEDWLPSLNLALSLSEQDIIRVAASRQISRPAFFDLRSTVAITFDGAGVPGGGGGNPFLRPYEANQVEIGYEHYIGRSGIISAGLFYKNLETFIIDGTITGFDFRANGFGPLLDNAPPPATGAAKQDVGTFNTPINGSGGEVYGIELQYSQAFDMLPAPFDGLGIILNYAYTESDLGITVRSSGSPVSLTLPGLSKHVFNPTLYYDKDGFGARVAARYRSKYVAPQVGQVSNPAVNDAETVIDAQLSYEFQEGSALKGLRLLLQANNVTDEPNKTYWGREALSSTQQYFGRTFFFGAAFAF